uniref:Uncharacterized protein n=1 Tax=Megaselia scalaris TaxID=36166 RepID=T1GW83_MEGSC
MPLDVASFMDTEVLEVCVAYNHITCNYHCNQYHSIVIVVIMKAGLSYCTKKVLFTITISTIFRSYAGMMSRFLPSLSQKMSFSVSSDTSIVISCEECVFYPILVHVTSGVVFLSAERNGDYAESFLVKEYHKHRQDEEFLYD